MMRAPLVGMIALLVWLPLAVAAWAQSTKPAANTTAAAQNPLLTPERLAKSAANYDRYCALCHGKDRAGHANDEAPSLRSKNLLESVHRIGIVDAMRYGRAGTAMGGYLDEVGGPLTQQDLQAMLLWLAKEAGADPFKEKTPLPTLPKGDVAHGGKLYAAQCASCHGDKGQGGLGTALRNASMLALTPDGFLQEAIMKGRDGTPMQAYGDKLSAHDIASLLAWMRAAPIGKMATDKTLYAPPSPQHYILNPKGKPPVFNLQDGIYVKAADLKRVLEARPRIVLLDTRVMSMWQAGHIAGAVPVPYYSSREEVVRHLPRDGTWIVAYCECPRAAAESVVKKLREAGFKNTAVLYEGIGGWVSAGYPTVRGTLENAPAISLIEGGNGLDNFERVGDANWRSEAGAIMADAKTGEKSGFLVTKQSYADFEATIEFWASSDANSGVYSRCADAKKPTDVDCYEVNIFDQRPDPTYGTAAIPHRAAVPAGKYLAGGRWNTFVIRMRGDHITVDFNGQRSVDIHDATRASGPIGLQYNKGVVKFRKFVIRAL